MTAGGSALSESLLQISLKFPVEKCVLFASPVMIYFLPIILEEDAEFNSKDQSGGRPVCRIASNTFGFNSGHASNIAAINMSPAIPPIGFR